MEKTLALPHGLLVWDDIGPRDAAITMVLVHGFPHDRALWSAQAAAQPATFGDIRMLIPDLPGFGRSAPLAAASMDGYADAIESMLESAGIQRAVIGGLSMGGYVAFAFWRRHAELVQALMLMDTKAGADTDAARDKRRELIATVQRDGVGAIVPTLLPQQLGRSTRELAPEVVERVEVMLRRAPAAGVTGAAQALMDRPDSTPTLDTITVPTLVIVGEEDTLTPLGEALMMSSAIQSSRMVTILEAGHLAPLEQPETVNAIIAEFLDVAVRGDVGAGGARGE
jgi:pimeloyl-ACP methyl ester carboxylesterase